MLGFVRWAASRAAERPGLAFAGHAGILIQVACSLAMPLLLEYLIDDVIPARDYTQLGWSVGIVGVATVSYFFGGLLVDWASSRFAAETIADLRLAMFERIQNAPASFFAHASEGEVVTRFGSDCTTIESVLVRGLPVAIRRFLKIIVTGIVLFTMDWRVALLVFLTLPFTILMARPIAARGTKHDVGRKLGEGEIAKLVQESLASHLVVKAFELERYLKDRLDGLVDRIRNRSTRANLLYATSGSFSSLGIAVLELAVVGVGALVVVGGSLTIGVLVAFIGLLRNVTASARGLTETAPMLLGGATSLARTQELLTLQMPSVREGTKALNRLQDGIVFEDVDFSYDGQSGKALDGVSFEIPAGRRVAFVGRSGSGKSTTLSLLMRLIEPTRGSVSFDGTDVREATYASLRKQTGVVLQDTALFDASVRENIRCGRLDADDDAIVDAARRARIHDVIELLADGYETGVGARGVRLSGGQRQRVAIARALVREPSLLLLDEATSALDPAAESEVNDTLREVAAGHTVVAVTHRLPSVIDYDRILVFDEGRVVEQGTHDELRGRDGLYEALWQKQSGFEVEPSGATARVTADRLQRMPFWSEAPLEALEHLSTTLVPERFRAGDVVFEKGAAGDRFYLIARGRLEAYLPEQDRVLRVMEDGDFFGEIALVKRTTRTASVRAVADSLCLSLGHRDFERLLSEYPALSREVVETAVQRIANG